MYSAVFSTLSAKSGAHTQVYTYKNIHFFLAHKKNGWSIVMNIISTSKITPRKATVSSVNLATGHLNENFDVKNSSDIVYNVTQSTNESRKA